MPNIVFVGFPRIDVVVFQPQVAEILAGENCSEESIMTVCEFPGTRIVDFDFSQGVPKIHHYDHAALRGEQSPYVIVRDTSDGRMLRIGYLINEKLNLDVEVELIDHFFPKRK